MQYLSLKTLVRKYARSKHGGHSGVGSNEGECRILGRRLGTQIPVPQAPGKPATTIKCEAGVGVLAQLGQTIWGDSGGSFAADPTLHSTAPPAILVHRKICANSLLQNTFCSLQPTFVCIGQQKALEYFLNQQIGKKSSYASER